MDRRIPRSGGPVIAQSEVLFKSLEYGVPNVIVELAERPGYLPAIDFGAWTELYERGRAYLVARMTNVGCVFREQHRSSIQLQDVSAVTPDASPIM